MPILWAWNVFGWSRWAPNIGRKCSCSAWIRSRRLTKLVNCAFRTNWSRIVEKMLLGLHVYVEWKWENFSEVEFSKSRFGIIGFNRPDSRFVRKNKLCRCGVNVCSNIRIPILWPCGFLWNCCPMSAVYVPNGHLFKRDGWWSWRRSEPSGSNIYFLGLRRISSGSVRRGVRRR